MRVIQTQVLDLLKIMECYFQRAIRIAIWVAVIVQLETINSGESKYQSSCAYYYSFIFSGWWFKPCTYVALNGKYNPTISGRGFLWYSPVIGYYVHPIRSEMKIRQQ
jgi:hypothetical protein